MYLHRPPVQEVGAFSMYCKCDVSTAMRAPGICGYNPAAACVGLVRTRLGWPHKPCKGQRAATVGVDMALTYDEVDVGVSVAHLRDD